MTLGELKLECLKVMYEIEETNVNPSTISTNPEYSSRITGMIDSINRALNRIDSQNKIPIKEDDTLIQKTHTYDDDLEMWFLNYLPNNLADNIDLATYGLKDYYLRIIPYFVKADLFEEDNQSASTQARNFFEGYLSQLPIPPKNDKIRKNNPSNSMPDITKIFDIYRWDE